MIIEIFLEPVCFERRPKIVPDQLLVLGWKATVGIYVATMQEKLFLGSDGSFYNDVLQGIHLC